jgi:ubiquinone/menaquinone biosynthesis C-methylase UbiE
VTGDWLADTRASYDTVAASYAELLRDSLADQPVVRHVLALFAEKIHGVGGGPVVDVGCGTGRVTRHLCGLGLDTSGIDLSPGMIEMARQEYPGLRFEVGSMTGLDRADGSVTGVVAWFSIIHVPDEAVRAAFHEFRRVLRADGVLLLGFHVGDTVTLRTQGYGGHPMKVYVHKRPVARVVEWLAGTGFRLEVQVEEHVDATTAGGMLIARPV